MDPRLIRYLAISLMMLVVAGIGYQAFQSTLNPIESLPNFGEAPDFTLPDVDGENFTLSDSDGKIRILTFIYTQCTMGCSIITHKFLEMKEELTDMGIYNEVQLITVDFDYRFDTMENLTDYRNIFSDSSDSWQFLLGTENQTLEVTEAYNFYFELDMSNMNSTDDSDMGDMNNSTDTDHSGHEVVYIHPFITWFIDQNGDFRSAQGGLDWTVERGVNIVDFLLNEE